MGRWTELEGRHRELKTLLDITLEAAIKVRLEPNKEIRGEYAEGVLMATVDVLSSIVEGTKLGDIGVQLGLVDEGEVDDMVAEIRVWAAEMIEKARGSNGNV